MSNELKLDAKAIEEIKLNLIKEKQQILEDLQDLSKKDSHETDNMTAKFPEYGDKPDENAQEINDYSTTVQAEKVLEKTLEDINKTLERMEKGIYGICRYCNNVINPKRLIARPTANSCIDCKTKLQEENE